jgi:ABC-type glycerol-3-phosphate transport system permease component
MLRPRISGKRLLDERARHVGGTRSGTVRTPRNKNLKVIQVALAGFEELYVTLWNELFAAAIVAALIPLIILLPLQRFYVQGVTAAATKD